MEDIWKRVRRVLHVDLREDLPGRSRSTCRMIFLRHVESRSRSTWYRFNKSRSRSTSLATCRNFLLDLDLGGGGVVPLSIALVYIK